MTPEQIKQLEIEVRSHIVGADAEHFDECDCWFCNLLRRCGDALFASAEAMRERDELRERLREQQQTIDNLLAALNKFRAYGALPPAQGGGA